MVWPFASAPDAQTALRESYARGEWSVVPTYPMGHAQIADFLPWEAGTLRAVLSITVALILVRRVMRSVVPPLGRRAGAWLHGAGWRGADKVDWRRFSDVCHCTVEHTALTAFAVIALGDELRGWFREPAQWWAFSQPALSAPLHAYYVAELGVTCEAAVAMLVGVLSGRAKDGPMMVHHAATLFVLLFAWRCGFARVGAAVLFLHDATDLPIDAMWILRPLECDAPLKASAVAALLSWGWLRAYVFPRYIIASIFFASTHMWDIFGDVGMSERQIYTAYVGYVTPLVVLWLLHCYWLTLIVAGILKELRPAKREAGAARGTDATGAAETLPPLPSRPGAAPTRRPSSKGLRARKI